MYLSVNEVSFVPSDIKTNIHYLQQRLGFGEEKRSPRLTGIHECDEQKDRVQDAQLFTPRDHSPESQSPHRCHILSRDQNVLNPQVVHRLCAVKRRPTCTLICPVSHEGIVTSACVKSKIYYENEVNYIRLTLTFVHINIYLPNTRTILNINSF